MFFEYGAQLNKALWKVEMTRRDYTAKMLLLVVILSASAGERCKLPISFLCLLPFMLDVYGTQLEKTL